MTPDQLQRGVYEGHDGSFRHLREVNPRSGRGFYVPVSGGRGRRVTLERFARWAKRQLSPGFAKAFLAEMENIA